MFYPHWISSIHTRFLFIPGSNHNRSLQISLYSRPKPVQPTPFLFTLPKQCTGLATCMSTCLVLPFHLIVFYFLIFYLDFCLSCNSSTHDSSTLIPHQIRFRQASEKSRSLSHKSLSKNLFSLSLSNHHTFLMRLSCY
jgi:hypothetical protein